jgi:hypothetical protein
MCQIFVRGWKKKSILSLHLATNLCERMGKKFILSLLLAPNLCERMEKTSILSLHLAPNLCERMGKKFHPYTGMIPNLNFIVSYYLCSSKTYHRRFMLLALPVVVVAVLFVAFQEQWLV